MYAWRPSASVLLWASLEVVGVGQTRSGNRNGQQGPQSLQLVQPSSTASAEQTSNELKQQLDVDKEALSQIPVSPLVRRDPLRSIVDPFNHFTDRMQTAAHLKLGATYTFLNQYATEAPSDIRRDQVGGRLDLTAAWAAYDRESSAGSLSMLVRSGSNIGISQSFNLSDSLGSGLTLNCLQGGGRQRPLTLNALYWREDLLGRRLSLYVGKIHPNQYIALSQFNDNETSQFLNGANDGNAAIAYNGIYAGGAAVEYQATPHFYIHAVAVDTEGGSDRGLETLPDKKYMEAVQLGWSFGSLGQSYQNLYVGVWRDDTRTQGSGFGGGFSVEHEFVNGWAPFVRYALATEKGTTLKEVAAFGLTNVHPFRRHGDMFGAAFNYSEPSSGRHHESVFESFYRLRVTQSVDLGPDLEVSVHPTYAEKAYATTLVSARFRIIF